MNDGPVTVLVEVPSPKSASPKSASPKSASPKSARRTPSSHDTRVIRPRYHAWSHGRHGARRPGACGSGHSRSLDLSGLNPAQYEAVTLPAGPVLVIAGAGSGKTRVLTHRLAYLVAELGVSPFEILAITFTNKAAGEMRERVAQLVGPVGAPHVGLHLPRRVLAHPAPGSVAARLPVELHDLRPGRRRRASPTGSAATSTSTRSGSRPASSTRQICALKNELVLPAEYAAAAVGPAERRVAEIYTRVPAPAAEASAVDFDDLLVLTVRLFREHPEALRAVPAALPARARRRVPGHERRAVGARAPARARAPQHHGRGRRRPERLQVPRRRLPQPLAVRGGVPRRDDRRARPELPVDAAHPRRRERGHREQRVDVARSTSGPTRASASRSSATRATTSTTRPQFVVREIHRLVDGAEHRYGDIAVFYRTNAQSRVLEEALVRAGVPYRVFGGVKFYDRREIKDALAYLRALVNPDDEVSWKRIVNTPKRGVGDTSIAKVDAYAHGRGHHVPRRAASEAAAAGVTGKALGGIRDLLDLMAEVELAAAGRSRHDARGGARRAAATSPSSKRSGRSSRTAASRTCRSSSARRASSTSRSSAANSAGSRRSAASGSATRATGAAERRRQSARSGGARAGPGVPRGDLARHRPRRERSRSRARSR